MVEILISIELAYLVGLGILGYVCLLTAIKIFGKRRKWSGWVVISLLGIHFVLGIGAVCFVPAIFFLRLKGDVTNAGGILFALIGFAMLCVAFLVAKGWNHIWTHNLKQSDLNEQSGAR